MGTQGEAVGRRQPPAPLSLRPLPLGTLNSCSEGSKSGRSGTLDGWLSAPNQRSPETPAALETVATQTPCHAIYVLQCQHPGPRDNVGSALST